MACQSANSLINKPYDDETCRAGLYHILECLLINERTDCSTIIGISKDLIDTASLLDSSIKVRTHTKTNILVFFKKQKEKVQF